MARNDVPKITMITPIITLHLNYCTLKQSGGLKDMSFSIAAWEVDSQPTISDWWL